MALYYLLLGCSYILLMCSIVLNLFQRFQNHSQIKELQDLKKSHDEEKSHLRIQLESEWKEKIQKPQDSYELQQFLGDLLAGGGMIEVRRVAPTEFFIRSPRSG